MSVLRVKDFCQPGWGLRPGGFSAKIPQRPEAPSPNLGVSLWEQFSPLSLSFLPPS